MMIKNVIFDVGGVLVDFRWRALMAELGLSVERQDEFEKKVFGSKWWAELDRGALDEEYVVGKLRENISDHLEAFEMVWANQEYLVESYDYAAPWMDSLKEKGLKIYLLSNYPKSIFSLHEKTGRFSFIDRIDGRVVSGFVGLSKPDADIYKLLVDKYNLKFDECVFIDDREENIKAACDLGMEGIVFKSYGQARADLEKLLAPQE
jgi:putative hydrolase of the HAD superfamily